MGEPLRKEDHRKATRSQGLSLRGTSRSLAEVA